MPPKKSKRKLSPARVVGILLIIAGICLLGYVPYTYLRGVIEQRSLRGEFAQESAASLALNQQVLDKLQGAADSEKLRQLAEAYKSRLSSGQIIGQLEIPKMGLSAIIVEGSADDDLHKGPGHMEETPLPGMGGNFAVAGDRVLYGAPFLKLNDLVGGDQIIMRTQYGQFNYTVTDKHITEPEDTSVLQSLNYETITLITCDPIWSTAHRLIVQAKLTDAKVIDKPAPAASTASGG